MRHGVSVIVVCLVGVLALAGCTSSSPGRAEPAPSGSRSPEATTSTSRTTEPSGESLPSDGAPKVKNPLDTNRYQQNPCLVLTAAQTQELNVGSPGEQRPGPLGEACDWRNSETGGNIDMQFGDLDPQGLSATYKANKAGKWVYFVELPEIEGFPAVARAPLDRRDKGDCAIEVGVSDRVTFQLGVQLSRANVGKKDPCEVTVMVAGMMLRTMKAGG